jgi:hypothetical protein
MPPPGEKVKIKPETFPYIIFDFSFFIGVRAGCLAYSAQVAKMQNGK